MPNDYLVQEEDGTSHFLLEENAPGVLDAIILEESTGGGAAATDIYVSILRRRRRG